MVTGETEIALRFLSLIALALPAIALLMVVMTEIYRRGGLQYTTSEADKEPDFALAQYSLFTFLLAALALIGYVAFPSLRLVLSIGFVLIVLALLILALSVLFMARPTLKDTITSMKERAAPRED